MNASAKGIGFYGLFGGLLLSVSLLLTGARPRSVDDALRMWLYGVVVPAGAVRDMTLAPFTVTDVRLASTDSLDLFLQWFPPQSDGTDTLGAVDSIVTVFYYGGDDEAGMPTVSVRLREVSLYAIDRTWIQRVPIRRLTGQAWNRVDRVLACAIIHRRWPDQNREVWGAFTCGLAQYIERRRNDASLRLYREAPFPFDMGPNHNTYPPVPKAPAVDSIFPPMVRSL